MRPFRGAFWKLLGILGPALSGILLVLAFPQRDQHWLAWVCLLPLLISLSMRGPAAGATVSFLCGLVFFWLVFSWVLQVPGYRPIHHLIVVAYLGLYFALFGLAFCLISKRWSRVGALFAAPFLWVAIEYARANLGFLALPWAYLSHSQYRNLEIIQICSLTGAYGVSFLIVMVNAAVTVVLLEFLQRGKNSKPAILAPLSRQGSVGLIGTTLLLTALALAYGLVSMSQPTGGDRVIRTSVLQGNIEQEKKWDRRFGDSIMQTYVDLSAEASKEGPSLIVWPEAATPGHILRNMSYLTTLRSVIKETKAHYLVGSAEYPKLGKVRPGSEGIGNTAIFFSPDGRIGGQYFKIWLVPFREYIPYNDRIEWPSFIVPQGVRFYEKQGKEFTLFGLDGTKFGVVICWESIFPEILRQFVKRGAEFILNITNEAPFGASACPYQILAISVFRAVENRVYLVRAANTGISCFIDPRGRIVSTLNKDGKEIFVKGWLTQDVLVSDQKTFYTSYGDVFAYLCLAVSMILVGVSLVKGFGFRQ
jgi:apolipoprotein N-acyltransferase